MDNGMMMDNKTCKCVHHKFIPILALLFAILFLLGATAPTVFTSGIVSVVWPILVGIAAILKLGEGNCKCC